MATWNGSVITLDNDAFATGLGALFVMSGVSAVSGGTGTIATTGKSYIVTGWNLSLDTNTVAARLKFGHSADNIGTSPTYLATGHVADSAGLKTPWISPPGTMIAFPSGKAFLIASTISCNLSGFIQIQTL